MSPVTLELSGPRQNNVRFLVPEDTCKIYAESFLGFDRLKRIPDEVPRIVDVAAGWLSSIGTVAYRRQSKEFLFF